MDMNKKNKNTKNARTKRMEYCIPSKHRKHLNLENKKTKYVTNKTAK